ncbi:Hsp20 family protein [Salinimonas chungwhensis]|uniref:Hsp20 family protein n=1 Tax=Salinimonas chungwhensis TaxID=265425 RepID=UPI0004772973|nr:Hsp20 family protein [Salinimonas chungwhensis]
MRSVDLTPLYRSFIGSDHLANMIDAATQSEKQSGYPPYNVEVLSETKYRITMAVAGFTQQDIDIEMLENTLTIAGKKAPKAAGAPERTFLHKGISERGFERKFQLGDNVKVLGAELEHGLLNIDMERILPEAKKPKKIEISNKLQHAR